MKKALLLSIILGLLASFAIGQQTWDNFEDQRKGNYSFYNGVYIPYLANPDMTGNTSPIVAKYSRNAAETFDVIVIDSESLMEDLTDYVSNTKQMTLDVWSTAAGIPVQITLEDSALAGATNYPMGRHSEYTATTTQAMAWETLTFTFANMPDPAVSNTNVGRMVILFNPNTNTDNQFFFDNLVGPALAADPCDGVMTSDSILNDFECNQNTTIRFHSGDSLYRQPNPDPTGANTSSYAVRYRRNGAEMDDVIIGNFPTAPVLGDTNQFSISFLDAGEGPSPTTVTLSLQFDDGSGTLVDVAAATVNTTVANRWEVLNFNFGDLSAATINTFVILIAQGTNTSGLYYMDDFSFAKDGGFVGIEDFISGGRLDVYPNPSQGMTQFSYDLISPATVSLKIYDLAGRQIDAITPGLQAAGNNTIMWDAPQVPEGLYIYRFQVNDQISSGKIQIAH